MHTISPSAQSTDCPFPIHTLLKHTWKCHGSCSDSAHTHDYTLQYILGASCCTFTVACTVVLLQCNTMTVNVNVSYRGKIFCYFMTSLLNLVKSFISPWHLKTLTVKSHLNADWNAHRKVSLNEWPLHKSVAIQMSSCENWGVWNMQAFFISAYVFIMVPEYGNTINYSLK